jgi:hypothetical protein
MYSLHEVIFCTLTYYSVFINPKNKEVVEQFSRKSDSNEGEVCVIKFTSLQPLRSEIHVNTRKRKIITSENSSGIFNNTILTETYVPLHALPNTHINLGLTSILTKVSPPEKKKKQEDNCQRLPNQVFLFSFFV